MILKNIDYLEQTNKQKGTKMCLEPFPQLGCLNKQKKLQSLI